MLFAKFVPPSPSPAISTSPFSMSASVVLPYRYDFRGPLNLELEINCKLSHVLESIWEHFEINAFFF